MVEATLENRLEGRVQVILKDGKKHYRFLPRSRKLGERVTLSSAHVNDHVIAWKRTIQCIDWILRTSTWNFLSFSALAYISMTFIFALIIMAIARIEPRCITTSVFDDDHSFIAGLNDAWQLSWTTYSTVGYGVNAPSAIGAFYKRDEFRSCVFMNFILSFESLAGILAVSFASAIIFGKLMQFQSDAKIKFSSKMVVKYGSRLSTNKSKISMKGVKKDLPCPVIEFRIVNLLHDNLFGDIVGAELHSVATVKKENAIIQKQTNNHSFSNAMQSKRNIYDEERRNSRFHKFKRQVSLEKKGKAVSSSSLPLQRSTGNELHSPLTKSDSAFGRSIDNLRGHWASHQYKSNDYTEMDTNEKKDELRSSVIVDKEREVEMPNLVFENISLDPKNHPCFGTSWSVVHTLDENSPLLKKDIRNEVKELGGKWPGDKVGKAHISDSIHFDQFLVSFKGLSKATGTDVYSHKVYKMDDLEFGHRFESILVRKSLKYIGVAADDIDKTRPQ